MPSSTSNSEVIPRYYHTPDLPWRSVVLAALVVGLIGAGTWEVFWRSQGYVASYANSSGLWSEARRSVGDNREKDVVIVGSSRILFDLDLAVLAEELGGPMPVQLALEGTNPRPFLRDVAHDASFNGLLIVGVTPGLFFGPPVGERADMLDRHRRQTPSDRLGHLLSMTLETRLASVDPDIRFFAVLERLDWPARAGMPPRFLGVRKLATMMRTRQADMWQRVEQDEAYRKLCQQVWLTILGFPRPPITDELIDQAISEVIDDVQAVQSRGGRVVFVRCPSTGPFLEAELKGLPREKGWDRLIAETRCTGIHFQDYAQLQGLDLPEWSHLAVHEKTRFTRSLAALIRPVNQAKR